MEKILLTLDRRSINMNVVDFACYIARLSRSELTVIFLQDGTLEPAVENSVITNNEGARSSSILQKTEAQDPVENLFLFESACQNRGIRTRIHENMGDPMSEIIAESRFADLLVADPEMSFTNKREATPTSFIKEVLARSECPVAIAPYTFTGIEEIIFAYDGSASAVFAIKQFTYLLPGLSEHMLTVLQVSHDKPAPLIEKKKLIEFLQMHYSSIGYRILEGKASDELFKFLHNKRNIFVVMGAYGRRNLSLFFKHSTADLLLKAVNLPLFIAHKD